MPKLTNVRPFYEAGLSHDAVRALLELNNEELKTVTIISPTNSEDVGVVFAREPFNIQRMTAVCVGSSPSVTWTIRHGADRSDTGTEVVTGGTTTTNTTTGDVITDMDSSKIPGNSHLWLETTAKSGTVDSITITIEYTVD